MIQAEDWISIEPSLWRECAGGYRSGHLAQTADFSWHHSKAHLRIISAAVCSYPPSPTDPTPGSASAVYSRCWGFSFYRLPLKPSSPFNPSLRFSLSVPLCQDCVRLTTVLLWVLSFISNPPPGKAGGVCFLHHSSPLLHTLLPLVHPPSVGERKNTLVVSLNWAREKQRERYTVWKCLGWEGPEGWISAKSLMFESINQSLGFVWDPAQRNRQWWIYCSKANEWRAFDACRDVERWSGGDGVSLFWVLFMVIALPGANNTSLDPRASSATWTLHFKQRQNASKSIIQRLKYKTGIDITKQRANDGNVKL